VYRFRDTNGERSRVQRVALRDIDSQPSTGAPPLPPVSLSPIASGLRPALPLPLSFITFYLPPRHEVHGAESENHRAEPALLRIRQRLCLLRALWASVVNALKLAVDPIFLLARDTWTCHNPPQWNLLDEAATNRSVTHVDGLTRRSRNRDAGHRDWTADQETAQKIVAIVSCSWPALWMGLLQVISECQPH